MAEADKDFFDRVDAHIHLSNGQLNDKTTIGQVSASNMYAVARFNAWVTACGNKSGKEMSQAKQETLKYFTEEYRKMLEVHLDDYINNFDTYINISK